jgi:Domain of unknown function (DUF4158)
LYSQLEIEVVVSIPAIFSIVEFPMPKFLKIIFHHQPPYQLYPHAVGFHGRARLWILVWYVRHNSMPFRGFCPTDLHTASSDVTTSLASQLQVDPSALQDYRKRRMTRSTHFNAVLQHLGFRRVQPDDQAPIVAWWTERAFEHDKPTLWFHMLCEHLKQQQRSRPAVTTVERWVVTTRIQAHHESLHRLQFLLTPERMTLLDSLLVSE